MNKSLKTYKKISLCVISSLVITTSYANDGLISLFPLKNYEQTISTWIKPSDPNFDKRLLSQDMQEKRLEIFYKHYFGSLSPWDANYINQILHQSPPENLKTIEQQILTLFNNAGKSPDQIGYGENFRPHTEDWILNIANNIDVSRLENLSFQANNRGIAIRNLSARALPTKDVHFYSYKLAGQGYPFDNLQISSLWAGTPVYIILETYDHAWMLVVTPDYIGWVNSNGIARVDNGFIKEWSATAKDKLAAITHTPTSIVDNQQQFLFTAYTGSVFPAKIIDKKMYLLVPVNDMNYNAHIKMAMVSDQNAALMPVAITPHHFSDFMNSMINRPYGWGNLYFYNDCSAELKNIFTPFGIWLPRHSSDQTKAGKMVDMSSFPQEKRLSYLMENGQSFLTIIYIGGHVILYIGNYNNPMKEASLMAMTYQNIWGLSPNPPIRRAVIGESVLFPMLLVYPEDPSLISLANKKYFQVTYLSEIPPDFLLWQEKINLKTLMYPSLALAANA